MLHEWEGGDVQAAEHLSLCQHPINRMVSVFMLASRSGLTPLERRAQMEMSSGLLPIELPMLAVTVRRVAVTSILQMEHQHLSHHTAQSDMVWLGYWTHGGIPCGRGRARRDMQRYSQRGRAQWTHHTWYSSGH